MIDITLGSMRLKFCEGSEGSTRNLGFIGESIEPHILLE